MDIAFWPAAAAIGTGDLGGLARQLAEDPDLATRRSTVSHPTLLQLVACDHATLPDPLGAARLLVDAGSELGGPLVAAAGCNAGPLVELLLDRGAPIDGDGGWTPLDEALYWANGALAARLVARGAAVHTLRAAAGAGLTARVAERLASGAWGSIRSPFPDTVPAALADDPGAILDHAFVMAVNNGQRPAAQRLLDRGARVNAAPPGYHWRGTALHAAVWRGDRGLVAWLLSLGADPAVRDGLVGSDAVGWAEHHGHGELVALLRGL